MYIEFTTHGHEVSGTLHHEPVGAPQTAPDPSCEKCHGSGVVVTVVEPPDEFNDSANELYGECDCGVDVPPENVDAAPTLEVDAVYPEGSDTPLSAAETISFVNRVGGRARLAELADEELSARAG